MEQYIDTMEVLDAKPIGELASEVTIKVCWVADEPNPNYTVISKEVGKQIAETLPGAPIVGFFDSKVGDFRGHSRRVTIGDGLVKIEDLTKPYGFVSPSDKPWYQVFEEDGKERIYLMCKGYIWTKQYEEASKALNKGQSMELAEDTYDGYYQGKAFVITEVTLDKLCILGDDVDPCFSGAKIMSTYSQDFMSLAEQVEKITTQKYSLNLDQSVFVLKDGDEIVYEIPEDSPSSKGDNSKINAENSLTDSNISEGSGQINYSKEVISTESIQDTRNDTEMIATPEANQPASDFTKNTDKGESQVKIVTKPNSQEFSAKTPETPDVAPPENSVTPETQPTTNFSLKLGWNLEQAVYLQLAERGFEYPEIIGIFYEEGNLYCIFTNPQTAETFKVMVKEGENNTVVLATDISTVVLSWTSVGGDEKTVQEVLETPAANQTGAASPFYSESSAQKIQELEATIQSLEAEVNTYKLAKERDDKAKKESMLKQYSNLFSQEELTEIKADFDTATPSQLESKIAVAYMRKSVEKAQSAAQNYQLNVNAVNQEDNSIPSFMKAALAVENESNSPLKGLM